jgi:hypothetical protein
MRLPVKLRTAWSGTLASSYGMGFRQPVCRATLDGLNAGRDCGASTPISRTGSLAKPSFYKG